MTTDKNVSYINSKSFDKKMLVNNDSCIYLIDPCIYLNNNEILFRK